MLERYVETFFRHKWVLLFILFLVPTLGIGYAFDQKTTLYDAGATVWTQKPAFLSILGDWSQYQTPAQIQAANVHELLQTQYFDNEVISSTDLRFRMTTPQSRVAVIDHLRKKTVIEPVGTHILSIKYPDEDPKVGVQVVQAIIQAFNKEILDNLNSQGTVALGFFQKQLAQATTKQSDATAALSAYINAHPELSTYSSDK